MRILLALMFLAPFGALAAIRSGQPVLPVWTAMSVVALIILAFAEIKRE